MSDWPVKVVEPLVSIYPHSLESLGVDFNANGFGALTNYASATYAIAGAAYYIPFTITKQITVRRLFCWNGATANAGVCIGIYDLQGDRILTSGSTSQSTASVIQSFDVTDTAIGPGTFYMAISASTATQTFTTLNVGASLQNLRKMGVYSQSGAYPLPSTATFGTTSTVKIPFIGLTTRDLI